MRRMWVLYLILGLVSTQGCHKTMQHTAGACDCYPPPVESLLVAPCPSANGYVSGYAPAPYATSASPITVNAPAVNSPGRIEKSAEPIRSLPKILEPKK